MRVKQLRNLIIIKLNRVKQNYTQNDIVQTAFIFIKKDNNEFVKAICTMKRWWKQWKSFGRLYELVCQCF